MEDNSNEYNNKIFSLQEKISKTLKILAQNYVDIDNSLYDLKKLNATIKQNDPTKKDLISTFDEILKLSNEVNNENQNLSNYYKNELNKAQEIRNHYNQLKYNSKLISEDIKNFRLNLVETKEYNNLKLENESKEKIKNDLKTSINKYKEKLAKTDVYIKSLESRLKESSQQYESKLTEQLKLDKSYTQKNVEIANLTEKIEKNKLTNKTINQTYNDLNNEKQDLEIDIQNSEKTNAKLIEEINSIKKLIATKNLDNNHLNNTFIINTKNLENIKTKIEEIKKENIKIEESIEKNNEELEDLIKNKQILGGKESEILTTMQFANKDLVDQKQYTNLIKEKNNLEFQIKTKINEINKLEFVIATKINEITKFEIEIKSKENEIKELKVLNTEIESKRIHFTSQWLTTIMKFEKNAKIWYEKNKLKEELLLFKQEKNKSETSFSSSEKKIFDFFKDLENFENKFVNELKIKEKNEILSNQIITKLKNDIANCNDVKKIPQKVKKIAKLKLLNNNLSTKIIELENIISKKIESKKISLNNFLTKKRINNINLPDQNKRKVRILNKYSNNITNVYVDTNTFKRLWENPDSAIKEYNDKDYEIFEI